MTKRIGIAALLALATLAAPVGATVTFEYLFAGGYPNSISADGQTIAGNTTSWGAYRWTQATGMVPLGTDPTLAPGGAPGVSDDGTRVAATIRDADSTKSVMGMWTSGSGWSELMPPGPPDMIPVDRGESFVYALSGDGSTAVGLYYRSYGRAHAIRWTQAEGGVDLGAENPYNASRANGVNHDGSVVAGWDEYWRGNWRPAVWYNGVETVLTDSLGDGQCYGTNPVGTIVTGFCRNPATDTREVAKWTRTGSTWSATQYLGSVPGTAQTYGINLGHAVTTSGDMIVGYCSFDGSPFWTTGFVWTPQNGVQDVVNWLADHGVTVDPGFSILTLLDMTPDGQWIVGYGSDLTPPYTRRAFRIHNTDIADVPARTALTGLALEAPSPNPSAGATALAFTLPAAGDAELSIFDAAGRRVATVARMAMAAGPHRLMWDGRGDDGRLVANGMYFARLSAPQGAVSRRLVRIH